MKSNSIDPGALRLANPARRRWLMGAGAGVLAQMLPQGVEASFWDQPRRLSLVRVATGEAWSGCYWQNGAVDATGYPQVCSLMRDVAANQTASIHPRLLDLLCAIQAWVRPYGYTQPIQVLSGYRTPQTNASLEGAARNSMHLQGRAADIVLPGLPATYLGQLAARYAAGGVGFYVGRGFVHVDTGRLRYWSK